MWFTSKWNLGVMKLHYMKLYFSVCIIFKRTYKVIVKINFNICMPILKTTQFLWYIFKTWLKCQNIKNICNKKCVFYALVYWMFSHIKIFFISFKPPWKIWIAHSCFLLYKIITQHIYHPQVYNNHLYIIWLYENLIMLLWFHIFK